MTLLAAVAAALAVYVLGGRPRRLPAPPAGRPAGPRGGAAGPQGGRRAHLTPLATAGAALAAWSLAGPRAGPVAALLVAAFLPRLLGSLPTRERVERDRSSAATVPLLADLVAACVTAGAAVDTAVEEAAAVAGGPLGEEAGHAARAVRLGVPPRVAWAALLAPDRPPPVRAFARALVRSADSGAAPAAVLRAVADDARTAARAEGEAAVRRAAVLAVLPLGLCFLPAFVLAGVVPLVAGLLAEAV